MTFTSKGVLKCEVTTQMEEKLDFLKAVFLLIRLKQTVEFNYVTNLGMSPPTHVERLGLETLVNL